MKTLVTGATGYIGIPLTLALADRGIHVKALVRSEEKCQPIRHPLVELVKGDITDVGSLQRAVSDCKEIYHLAAFAGIWTKDPTLYHRINVEGSQQLLSLALKEGVRKVVMTSTAGVMGPAPDSGIPVNEGTSEKPDFYSNYDASKFEAEMEAFRFLKKGLEVVVVNPSRIYGPGLKGESNSVSHLVDLFSQGKWRFIPGDGSSQGNYAYIDDVVKGHLLAMEKGHPGRRYILGGVNISYNDLFSLLSELTARNARLYRIPVNLLTIWAYMEVFLARFTGRKPMIVPAFVKKLSKNWNLSSDKAIEELGYQITDLETGLKKTLHWIES